MSKMRLLRSSKAISKLVNFKVMVLYRSQVLFIGDRNLKNLILIFNFSNFIPLSQTALT